MRASDSEDVPGAAERLGEEERDAAQGDGVGAEGNLALGAEMEQIVADLLFAQAIRGEVVEMGELGDRADVGFDGTRGVAAQLQVLDHSAA